MSATTPASGRVYLVGAGPGDPALLTLRAVECLAEANLVIYDRLVPQELLRYAPKARTLGVADLPEPHADRHPRVCELMIEAARRGETVVRLKGGDPWIFGRGGEEAAALKAAGIEYEVVPGVTAALAAATASGIPLTERNLASSVTLVTGHECPGKTPTVDWASLARLPGTLAIYMGLSRLPEIFATLITHGKPAACPAACVEWAGTNRQRTVVGTLSDLPERVRVAGLSGPVIILIGHVVALRDQLQWFERRPLFGVSVIVTRPRHQAAEMIRRFEQLGARVFHQPVVEIGPPPDPTAVDAALDRLHEFDWLVFTSANGVSAFLDRLLQRGQDLRRLGGLRLAAIGSQTAAALERYHLRPDYTPEEFTSESLASGLVAHVRQKRVLLARADRGRETLLETLRELCSVQQVAAYSQRDVESLEPHVAEILRSQEAIVVTLTSSNIARGFLRMIGPELRAAVGKRIHLASISPVTSAAIREAGCPVSAEAKKYTSEGLIEAVVEWAATSSP
ncbi:MAG: uroporphyrinogen-III C-methyltransferase [Gemmatales bacterium]|nr:uroporphyrinogen-III C-methyltransferase [Gemmatales bacterium]MDW8386605.1 uroporphyrinogen-III C-methyltransferase [Gemmatales bacterium]